jgi:hypothetical protein
VYFALFVIDESLYGLQQMFCQVQVTVFETSEDQEDHWLNKEHARCFYVLTLHLMMTGDNYLLVEM